MPLAQEKRRRGQVELRFCAGDREQSIEILVARSGELDHFAIHHLLAGKADLAEQPPDRGMEPEDTADQLFREREEPIVAPDVQDFVAENGLLHATASSSGKFAGRSTAGRKKPKVTGLEIASEIRRSASTPQEETGRSGREWRRRRRETPEADGQPDEADQHARAEQKEGDLGGR